MNSPHHPSTRRIFAHRGTALLAPENTAAAFDLALGYKSDVLETDVRLSRDGVVMVTHDQTLERTTNGHGRVQDHSLSELKKLDAGIKFRDKDGKAYPDRQLQMLTLEEMLQRYPDVGINIDIKDKSHAAAEAVATIVKKTANPSLRWINVGSFHADVTQHFRSIAPEISTAATRQEAARLVFGSAKRVQPAYKLLQLPTAYWGIRLNGVKLINKAHQLGCSMVYWTINDAQQMKRLLNKGCDGIVSDRPDLALSVFEELGFK